MRIRVYYEDCTYEDFASLAEAEPGILEAPTSSVPPMSVWELDSGGEVVGLFACVWGGCLPTEQAAR